MLKQLVYIIEATTVILTFEQYMDITDKCMKEKVHHLCAHKARLFKCNDTKYNLLTFAYYIYYHNSVVNGAQPRMPGFVW